MTEQTWLDDGETGPPTLEDDLWYLENVIAAGYPPVKRDPEPYPGQMSITEVSFDADEYDTENMYKIDFNREPYDLYFDRPGIWQVGTIGNTKTVTIPHAGLWELRPGQEPRFIRP